MRTTKLRGQTLVETALVLPLFLMVIFGIIILGMGVFYQQQVTNVAREAARFASVSSATAQCPVAGDYDPALGVAPLSYPPGGCDRKVDRWPRMTARARSLVFGLPASGVRVAACWSGYRLGSAAGPIDSPPPGTYDVGTITSVHVQCDIDGRDPTTNATDIGCSDSLSTTDQASSISESPGRPVANTITAYACYVWNPPLAGFLLIPTEITLRGVITEPIQRQQ